jgi:uncharacterized protein (TIGR03435 family)
MLQALLEDRFHLKVRRETREIPVYALTLAKGGLKLKAFQKGSCVPIDFLNLEMSTLDSLSPDVHYCRNAGSEEGGIVTYEAQGTSLDEFSKIVLGVWTVRSSTGLALRDCLMSIWSMRLNERIRRQAARSLRGRLSLPRYNSSLG